MTSVPDRPNNFVRFMIASFALLLMTLVGLTFYKGQPQYTITPSMITILALIVVLVLSETFDNLSIGKILSLSREVTKIATEKDDLKRENVDLRNSLLSVATNVQQTQSSTTIQAMGSDLARALGVEKADESTDDIDDGEKLEDNSQQSPSQLDSEPIEQIDAGGYSKYLRYRQIALEKYFVEQNLPISELIRNVRFAKVVDALDPIMERQIRFDGFLKLPNQELFFTIAKGTDSPIFHTALYVMLSKIALYRQAKNIHAELIVICVDLPEKTENRNSNRDRRKMDGFRRLFQSLRPALASQLVRIENIALTEDEYKETKE